MSNTVIQIKKSSTPGAIPSALANGELALNFADGALFYKNATGQIVSFSSSAGGYNFGVINANNSLLVADVANDVLSIVAGRNITITANTLTDSITIDANEVTVNTGNVAPTGTDGKLWWNSELGRLLVYYTDADSSQWVEANPTVIPADLYTLAGAVTVDENGMVTVANLTVTDSFSYVNASSIIVGNSEITTVMLDTTSNSSQIIDAWSIGSYRMADYAITMKSGANVHATHLTVIHNDSVANSIEFGTCWTANLGTFITTYVDGVIRLNVIPTYAATNVRAVRTTTQCP